MTNNNNLTDWLEGKAAIESSCKRKGWVWAETLEEHYALEKIDAKLLESGYYDTK